ncbi:hypothetical protein ABZV31_07260 [Streptomyces sp. NPDC005202]|uniref:hypothetical protein n=1 Tax=Streptomyces sp. NPDC005202 TaxID=3157021 RepID=UPI0033BE0F44
MDQPPALHDTEAAGGAQASAAGALVWESDLADLTTAPLAVVDSLAPLPPTARVVEEVLRSRSGIRSGGTQPRAE